MLDFVEIGVVNRHVRKQLAMVSAVRGFRIPAVLQHLLDTHTVVVVLEGERLPFAGHLLELSADCPFIRPTAIVQRVADCIVGNGGAVVRRQLILPIRIAVSIRNRLNSRADSAGGIGVAYLAGDVSAVIVVVNPSGILMRIIYSNRLP